MEIFIVGATIFFAILFTMAAGELEKIAKELKKLNQNK